MADFICGPNPVSRDFEPLERKTTQHVYRHRGKKGERHMQTGRHGRGAREVETGGEGGGRDRGRDTYVNRET